jgi:hypothetical protein
MKKFGILLAIIVVILVGVIIFLGLKQPPRQQSNYFTEDPITWIQDNDATDQPDGSLVDVNRATRGEASVNNLQENYQTTYGTVSFFYHAIYKGASCRTICYDPKFYDEANMRDPSVIEGLANKYLSLRVGPELKPGDGIMDAFILARAEGQSFRFYIFVDDDWRKMMPKTNVVCTGDLESDSLTSVEPFDFGVMENGIYVMSLDCDDFVDNRESGGLMVGDIDRQGITELLNDKFNSTMIYVR